LAINNLLKWKTDMTRTELLTQAEQNLTDDPNALWEIWETIGTDKPLIQDIGERANEALTPEFTELTLNRQEALAVSWLIGKCTQDNPFHNAISQLIFGEW
jgi:hypothetical protein